MFHELLSFLAIAITFIAFFPYIRSIRRGQTRPHYFSWVIWGITTLIVFFAQLADDGGAGAWPTGLSALITFYVAYLAFRASKAEQIRRMDWVFLIAALGSLPLWYLTSDPLSAVLILTAIDLLGFGPTFRKAYHAPHEERLGFFLLMALRNAIACAALEHYSLTTLAFPVAVGGACVAFMLMVWGRRLWICRNQPDTLKQNKT